MLEFVVNLDRSYSPAGDSGYAWWNIGDRKLRIWLYGKILERQTGYAAEVDVVPADDPFGISPYELPRRKSDRSGPLASLIRGYLQGGPPEPLVDYLLETGDDAISEVLSKAIQPSSQVISLENSSPVGYLEKDVHRNVITG